MEPSTQTRENAWIGFLQEDPINLTTGPVGEFIGQDSSSGSAWLYNINEPNVNEDLEACAIFDREFASSSDPWSIPEAQRLTQLKNQCRQAEEQAALGTLAQTYAYCDGCSCMDDTDVRPAYSAPGLAPAPDTKEAAWGALRLRDNLTTCSRVIDGVKYACDPTCCVPTCR
jgi:hypothetical protein